MLELDNIQASYGKHPAISGLSLSIASGELLGLLGPSGCGKTTALRVVAGFHPLQGGRICFNGQVLSTPTLQVPPESRSMGMVFQDYALFPHLDVADNIAFGLHHDSATQRRARVNELLELTGIDELRHRWPNQLSGGQQQRVALARAMASRPSLLLLDEPFSNLDTDLREQLSTDVRSILKAEHMTAILVSHDQHEAFTFADRVAVIKAGRLLQCSRPSTLYHHPATAEVAAFIGDGRFMPGVALPGSRIQTELGIMQAENCTVQTGKNVKLLIRPQQLQRDPDGPVLATVTERAFKGGTIQYDLRLDSGTCLLAHFPTATRLNIGDRIPIRANLKAALCFPEDA